MCDIFVQNKHTIHLIVSNLLATRLCVWFFTCKKRGKTMKKNLAIIGVCAILTAPAMAVVQCVPLNQYTTCEHETYTTSISALSDMDLVCKTNGQKTNVKLISIGSYHTPQSVRGTLQEDVNVSRPSGEKLLHCYGKMIYPVSSSKWVYCGKGGAGGYTCNWTCALATGFEDFKAALFNPSNWLN